MPKGAGTAPLQDNKSDLVREPFSWLTHSTLVFLRRHDELNTVSSEDHVVKIFDELYSIYGSQNWWPGETQFETIVGAILTQNTSWHNVAKAIENLKSHKLLELNALVEAEPEFVKKLITPVGFFNVKYKRLKSVLDYLVSTELLKFSCEPVEELRDELLAINGIGPETADSILLYAFERPIFVVDAYTRRLFSRLGYGWMEKASYDEIQRFFMESLPLDTGLYNEYHALIVMHSKILCKKKPLCLDCVMTCLMRFEG